MSFRPKNLLPPLTLAVAILASYAAPGHAQRRQPQPPAAEVTAQPPMLPDSAIRPIRFRYIGPVGNRISAVVGIPGDPLTYYVGAASGGIWKTTDGGVHWEPIFDSMPVQSIGQLAIAPSDPNVIYAGTGEPWIRSHISIGNGMYQSTDAGKRWTHLGLENSGRIARVVIHPTNPDVVYVAAMGHSYGPQPDRGLYRTMDGGKSWEKVLFVDENTGAVDVAMDPSNPRILFAATWQLEIKTWGRESGGPGSGIYRTTDGGTTWKKLTGNGLPTKPFGKVSLAIPRTNPNRIYAQIETGDGLPWHGQETDRGELWRSDNGGERWQVVSYDRQYGGRQPYYTRMAVATDNENETYFLSAAWTRSLDGGRTADTTAGAASPGGDNHDVWIDPGNSNRMIVGNDGGVSISHTRGKTWYRIQLPIAQMYHATVDNAIPYNVYGNKQDGPSYRVPSNSRLGGFGGGGGGGGIPRGETHAVGGGESGWATPDPTDPNVIWSSASGSGSVGGIVVRYDERIRQAQQVEVWPVSTIGYPAAEVKYRFTWNAPLTISPHDHNKVYIGSQHVHVTTDGGRSWTVISPDLTRNDKSKQQISGGLTPDNIGVEYGDVIFALAESPLRPGLLWVGTNDGLVQLSRDGGTSWTNVTANLPGLPGWATISNIEPSRFDTAVAYLTVDGHQVNNRDPWVYRTADYGRTWKLIVNGLPKVPMGYAHIIREDPVRRGLLYLGTENGVYLSFNDGESWQPLQHNLPRAPVYGMVIQERFNDLVIATYGRGFWILDDLSPFQQLNSEVAAKDLHFFKPRAAFRFRNITAPATMPDDPTAGQNPPYGAVLNYYLKSAPKDSAKITILDAQGKTVRTLTGTRNVGLNRVSWNLQSDSTRQARLRTSPLYSPDVRPGPEGWRSAGIGTMSILMPPGTYTVKLKAGEREETQPLVVLKDPTSAGSEQDIRDQVSVLSQLQNDLATSVAMVDQIEVVRAQLQSIGRLLASDDQTKDVRAAADSLEQKFIAVEENLHQLTVTGRGQDNLRRPAKLTAKINYLAGGIASSDFAPTTQQREVKQLLEQEITTVRGQLEQLLSRDLTQFNAKLRERNIQNVMVSLQ
ncbi:MAG: sialidase [Gemmatimonadetes bacterium]|nr:sialidase [Gemmatimonadota bacterium]